MDQAPTDIDPEKLKVFKARLTAADKLPAQFPDSLKEAVCDIVDDLKAAGKKPEEVIIVVRRLCLGAGLSSGQYISGPNNRAVQSLVDKIISACIERYYQ